MQKVDGKCAACGGDGRREGVGWIEGQVVIPPERCTRCEGSGLEPGWTAESQPKENPFCTVAIQNAETAAYIHALLNTPTEYLVFNMEKQQHIDFDASFPGGIGRAREMVNSNQISTTPIWRQLKEALETEGITEKSAPWL